MKFTINYPGKNINNLMRKIGYLSLRGSYIRALDRNGYPRFHIYLEDNLNKEKLLFNLHLDQKKAIYKGISAHSGEYSGPIIEQEMERIKKILVEYEK